MAHDKQHALDSTADHAIATVTDNAILRGHDGGVGFQDSGVTIDDADAVQGVSEIQLVPKAASTGPEGTMFYNSADDSVYVATEV